MRRLFELHRETETPPARDCPAWRTWDEVYDEGHGIVLIGLERTPCFGECPAYTALIHAGGRVEYKGEMYVRRKGYHVGKARPYDFRCLAQFIAGTRFWEMESAYDF